MDRLQKRHYVICDKCGWRALNKPPPPHPLDSQLKYEPIPKEHSCPKCGNFRLSIEPAKGITKLISKLI